MERVVLQVVILSPFLLSQMIVIEGVARQTVSCNTTCSYYDWPLPEVDCQNQGLNEIPIGCNPLAETIDLRGNRITIIRPMTLEKYTNLEQLYLEFNLIANITQGAFHGCDSLVKVYLQRNALQVVGDGAFVGADRLERLFLTYNSIAILHHNAFQGLNNLLTLDVANNLLQTLPPRIFDSLVSLTTINLKNNKLLRIKGSLFAPLVNLKTLNLSDNLIMLITNFPVLPNLRKFDLYGNDLQDINDVSSKITNVVELYLGENRINCTCSVNTIREWIVEHWADDKVDSDRASVVCHEPPGLQGQALKNISKKNLCPELLPTSLPASQEKLLPRSLPASQEKLLPRSLPALQEVTTQSSSPTRLTFTQRFLHKENIQSIPAMKSTLTTDIPSTAQSDLADNLKQGIGLSEHSRLVLRAAYGICSATLSVLFVIVLWIVFKYWRSSRKRYQTQRSMREESQQTTRNTQMTTNTTNGDAEQGDEEEYESFSINSSTRLYNQDPTLDLPSQDAPTPTHHRSQDTDPVYISLEDALSIPRHPNFNPFMQVPPNRTYHTVLTTEGLTENSPDSGYVPHSYIPHCQHTTLNTLNTAPHPNHFTYDEQDSYTADIQTTTYTLTHFPNNLGFGQNTNPFLTPPNPFVHITEV